MAILEGFLPKHLSEEELTVALKESIASVGAASPQDMGKVMGVATKKLAGLADGKLLQLRCKNYWLSGNIDLNSRLSQPAI